MIPIQYLSVGIIGFLIYHFGSAPKTGQPNRLDKYIGFSTSLRFNIYEDYILHIHHWLYLCFILFVASGNSIVQAFCVGGIIQGLTYNDWYQVFYRKVE